LIVGRSAVSAVDGKSVDVPSTGRTASRSFGQSEEDEECTVKPDEIPIGETAEKFA
jgi:hypothetical protein